MQIVYHGSYCKVEHPEIKEGKYSKDFGVGFYCTILEEQAIKWAKKYDTQLAELMAQDPDYYTAILNIDRASEVNIAGNASATAGAINFNSNRLSS